MNIDENGYKRVKGLQVFSQQSPYLDDNINTYLKKEHPYIQLLSVRKRPNLAPLLTLKCECGDVYNRVFRFDYKQYRCPKCTQRMKTEAAKTSYSKVQRLARKRGMTLLQNFKTVGVRTNLDLIDDNGYKYNLSYRNLFESKRFNKFGKLFNPHWKYNLKVWGANIEGAEVLEYFVDNQHRGKLKLRCECGREFISNFNENKVTYQCLECYGRRSKLQSIVYDFLHREQIEFIPEFRINSCKDTVALPFDICLIEYNIFIEIDEKYGHNPAYNKPTSRHDEIKNNYCKQWNIPLLRITEEQIQDDSYKTIILQFIHEVTNRGNN